MTTENPGTDPSKGNPPAGDPGAKIEATPAIVQGDKGAPSPAPAVAGADPFAELDTETREWLGKRELKDAKSVAKQAREQDKHIGELNTKLKDAIRVPGKDATEEERAAFREKLGVPKTADEYGFEAPKALPDDLPYDGERDKRYASKAHELGIPKDAAAQLREWFIGEYVGDHNTAKSAANERTTQIAKDETAKLVKLWGPLDGKTAKANLAFADKALSVNPAAVDEFKRVGLIGGEQGQKVIQSAPIAELFAKIGMALFKEDTVVKGNPDRLDNPFADGASFNLTRAMQVFKQDEAFARSLIAAAGKKPSDFNIPG